MLKRIRERILPSVVTFCRTPAGAAGPVQFNRTGDRIEILTGEHPFTSFHFDAAGLDSLQIAASRTLVTQVQDWARDLFFLKSDIPPAQRTQSCLEVLKAKIGQ